MMTKLFLTAALAIALPAAPLLAQDAMGSDAMAGESMAMDAMTPMMSDEDLEVCVAEAQALSFAEVAAAAEHACHALHNGEAMEGDAMMDDAMEGDAMSGDAMAPAQ